MFKKRKMTKVEWLQQTVKFLRQDVDKLGKQSRLYRDGRRTSDETDYIDVDDAVMAIMRHLGITIERQEMDKANVISSKP